MTQFVARKRNGGQMMQNKLRILHYIPGFWLGGIESMYLNWYQNIDHNKIEFEMLRRTQGEDYPDLIEYRNMGGVDYKLASIRNILAFIKSVNEFFSAHHDYNIMHVHGVGDAYVLWKARKSGINNIIIHAHRAGENSGERFVFIKKRLSRFAIKQATHYFACSKLAAAWVFKQDADKAVIFYNAVDIDRFSYDSVVRENYRKHLGLLDKLVVGHIGRMSHQKNYPFLLSVFRALAKQNEKACLILVGDGPDRPKIEKAIEELGLINKVLMLGLRSDIPQLMQAMDVFVLPSHYEGFPVTIIEAQSAGLPCVVSDAVTDEVCLTELVRRVSLKDSAEIWIHVIKTLNKINITRYDYCGIMKEKGFAINMQIVLLENAYREITND
jgi:glycosyltransferase involved in cell wall biosynthesis